MTTPTTAENAADAATPEISVLIPAYNEEKLIGRTVDSVHESFAAILPRSYEIIVCDNNSTDRTAEVAVSKGAQVVAEPHNQIARARNTAAKSARGKWLIFLDGDTSLTPEILGKTISAFDAGKVCAGGCRLKFDRDNIGFLASVLTGFWNRISTFVKLAAGSYLFCYREAWADVGGFDEEVYAGEEVFFSQALKAWAKERGLKFQILTGATVVTSARKMDWYGPGQLLWHLVRMLRPGSVKRRESCSLWYTRPE